MDYRLDLENNNVVLRTDEESWNTKIVMDGIIEFQFDNNFIIVGNDKTTKFIRFGDLSINKKVFNYLKKNNESKETI